MCNGIMIARRGVEVIEWAKKRGDQMRKASVGRNMGVKLFGLGPMELPLRAR